jgi:DNA-binding MarR family transcriptional regulator
MQQNSALAAASLSHVITAVKSRMRQVALRRLAPFGLSAQQYQLLMAVAEGEARCHGELVRCTWMDKPTASRTLRTLQERGLLQAEPDPANRRRILFTLAPKAEALIRELQDFRQYMREGMEHSLAPGDRVRLRALLTEVMANLDRMEAELSAPVAGK